jgi:hypothetical protein
LESCPNSVTRFLQVQRCDPRDDVVALDPFADDDETQLGIIVREQRDSLDQEIEAFLGRQPAHTEDHLNLGVAVPRMRRGGRGPGELTSVHYGISDDDDPVVPLGAWPGFIASHSSRSNAVTRRRR